MPNALSNTRTSTLLNSLELQEARKTLQTYTSGMLRIVGEEVGTLSHERMQLSHSLQEFPAQSPVPFTAFSRFNRDFKHTSKSPLNQLVKVKTGNYRELYRAPQIYCAITKCFGFGAFSEY